jgi:endonuclease/exonuclease/phosphatase family metal-dependent hydrolase
MSQKTPAEAPPRRRWFARFPRTWRGRSLALVLGLLAVCVVWFGINRLTAAWRRVRVSSGSAAGSSDSPLEVLRVGIYNIAHGRGTGESNWNDESTPQRTERLREIGRFLRDADLDVVVLNEVDFDASWSGRVNQAAVIAEEAGFAHRVEQRNLDLAVPFFALRFGNAVLSRFPIVRATPLEYPDFAGWETLLAGKKRGVVAEIDVPGAGPPVRILAVHLSHRSAEVRVASAQMIAAERDRTDGLFIAAGDFNSTLPGFSVAPAEATETAALTALVEDHGFQTQAPPGKTGQTFPSTDPVQLIDWVLVSGPGRVVSRAVYPVEYSDHRPVIATIHLE